MAFENRDSAKTYQPQDGDTLKTIAERETESGNPITWQELAQYNWGTQDEDEIEMLLRDEMGTTTRSDNKKYVFSTNDTARSQLKIPRRYHQKSFPVNNTHQIRIHRKKCPKQFRACCSLPAITFGFNSSFIRPNVVDHLGLLESLAKTHADTKIMVFGHTDAVGDELYNKKLSERRAWSAYAFIINDAEAWETLYNHGDEDWGIPVIQEILADLGYDPGAIDGELGAKTKAAMRNFAGLPEGAPIANDATFRKDLFSAYMSGKHDIDLTKDRFMDPGYMGCGEFNLLEESDKKLEINRRVTFFFFHQDRLPNLPCKFADLSPCKHQMVTTESRYTEGFSCSFYDSWAEKCPAEAPPWLEVYLLDYDGHPIPDCPYQVRVGDSMLKHGVANKNGIARLPLGSPPTVTIDWDKVPGMSDSQYRFTADYYIEIPHGDITEACWRLLHNLGYLYDSSKEKYVYDFQEEWLLKASGDHTHIFDLIKSWHASGVPPKIGSEEIDYLDPWDEDLDEEEDENEDGPCGCVEEDD